MTTIAYCKKIFDDKNIAEIANLLKEIAVLRALPAEAREAIAHCCELRTHVAPGTILVHQDEAPEQKNAIRARKKSELKENNAVLILSGLCRRGRKEARVVIDYVGMRDAVGLQSLITNEPQFYETRTLTRCHYIIIHRNKFREAVAQHNVILVALLRYTQRVYFREVLLHDRTKRQTAKERIIQGLLDIIDNTYDPKSLPLLDGKDSLNVTYPFECDWLSQAVIADQTGASDATVTGTLKTLREKKWIETDIETKNIIITSEGIPGLANWLETSHAEKRVIVGFPAEEVDE